MKNITKSIKVIFIIGTISIIGLVNALQGGFSIHQFKSSMENKVQENLRHQSGEITNRLDARLMQVAKYAELLAYNIEAMPRYDSDLLLNNVEKYIESDSLIVGSGIWFEPNAYQQGVKYFGPYKYKDDNNKIVLTWDFSNANYDYFKYDWYKRGLATKDKVVWSEPYEDEVTKIAMITISSPIKREGKAIGVTSVDVNLKEFTEYIRNIKIGDTGYAFVISPAGYYLGHKDNDKNLKERISEEKDESIKQLGNEILKADSMFFSKTSAFGSESFVVASPIGNTGMRLVLVYPTAEAYREVNKVVMISIAIFFVVILLLSFAIVTIFNKKIGRPIDQLVQYSEQIAKGDLSVKINAISDDEMGRLAGSLGRMAENLRGVILRVMQTSEQVAASSEELTANSEQSAQAANQIAVSVTEMAAGSSAQMEEIDDATAVVEQLSAGIQQIATNANQVADQSAQAADKAKYGDRAVEKAVTQMKQIEATVNTSAQVVTKLGERSKEIGQIVDAISGIAGQTNLLALNAAIEAARAGEQGRGFAVVAEEVRKLAEQSQDAAKKIAELIGEIQGDTEKAVVAMNEGTQEVKTGAEVVNAAGIAFKEIMEVVGRVSDQVKEISAAIQQMSTGSQQIVGSVKKIDDHSKKMAGETQGVSAATEEQLASMEEVATSSQALAKLAEDLQTEVAKFRV